MQPVNNDKKYEGMSSGSPSTQPEEKFISLSTQENRSWNSLIAGIIGVNNTNEWKSEIKQNADTIVVTSTDSKLLELKDKLVSAQTLLNSLPIPLVTADIKSKQAPLDFKNIKFVNPNTPKLGIYIFKRLFGEDFVGETGMPKWQDNGKLLSVVLPKGSLRIQLTIDQIGAYSDCLKKASELQLINAIVEGNDLISNTPGKHEAPLNPIADKILQIRKDSDGSCCFIFDYGFLYQSFAPVQVVESTNNSGTDSIYEIQIPRNALFRLLAQAIPQEVLLVPVKNGSEAQPILFGDFKDGASPLMKIDILIDCTVSMIHKEKEKEEQKVNPELFVNHIKLLKQFIAELATRLPASLLELTGFKGPLYAESESFNKISDEKGIAKFLDNLKPDGQQTALCYAIKERLASNQNKAFILIIFTDGCDNVSGEYLNNLYKDQLQQQIDLLKKQSQPYKIVFVPMGIEAQNQDSLIQQLCKAAHGIIIPGAEVLNLEPLWQYLEQIVRPRKMFNIIAQGIHQQTINETVPVYEGMPNLTQATIKPTGKLTINGQPYVYMSRNQGELELVDQQTKQLREAKMLQPKPPSTAGNPFRSVGGRPRSSSAPNLNNISTSTPQPGIAPLIHTFP